MGLTVLVLAEGDAKDDPPALSFDAPRLVIGRGDGCEVRLPDPSVSSRHASLRQHGGSYLIVDEGSTNGTFLGEVRLAPHAPRVIENGDRVRVGRVWLELRLEIVAQSSSPQDTRELALQLVQQALASHGEEVVPRVIVIAGPDEGKVLLLLRSGVPMLVGRGHGVDLALDEVDASRRHVQIVRKAEQVWVRDLGSKNGTFLQGKRLPSERDALWRSGEELCIGQDVFIHQNPAMEALLELERCADEKIAAGEVLQAPEDVSSPELSPLPSEASLPGSSEKAELSPLAPIAEVPRGNPRPPVSRSGWGASDVLVVILALGVLILSFGGLWLVFR